jgi:hypothetical protein
MPISSYNEQALRVYFESQLAREWWRYRPWFEKVTEIGEQLEGTPWAEASPVRISVFLRAFRSLTENGRYEYAAWSWLRPHDGGIPLTRLGPLKARCGLDHVEDSALASRVEEICHRVLENHREFSPWVRRRIALLEKCKRSIRDDRDVEWQTKEMQCESLLLAAMRDFDEYPREASDLAAKACRQALEFAGKAVFEVLGHPGEDCHYRANLMIPADLAGPAGPGFEPNTAAKANAAMSADLWRGLESKRCLVIVGESDSARHLGFWVPVVAGEHGKHLPGAPTAYRDLRGSAVFKDDPPFLTPWFPESLNYRWLEYVQTRFQDDLFVSLPIVIAAETGQRRAVAVLNVNARPAPSDGWRRAYHEEWLRLATRHAARFAISAYRGVVIQLACPGTHLNRLPGADASASIMLDALGGAPTGRSALPPAMTSEPENEGDRRDRRPSA